MPKHYPALAVILIACVLVVVGCQQPSPVAPTEVTIAGPRAIDVGQSVTFAAAIEPVTTTVPLTYLWEATGNTPISVTSGLTGTATFTWAEPGEHTVTLTVSNASGKTSRAYRFVVARPLPADPLAAIETTADQQAAIKTQHMDMNMQFNLKLDGLTGDQAQAAALFKNFRANLNLSGDMDNVKQDFDLKGDLDLGPLTAFLTQGEDMLEFEVVKVGDKMYTKANVGETAGEWQEQDVPLPTNTESTDNPLNPEMIASLLKQSSQVEKFADEKIGAVDTYHFKVKLNPEALIDSIAKLAQSTGAAVDETQLTEVNKILKDAVLEVDVWVGKQDLLIRQSKIHFNLNLEDIPDQPGATALIDLALTTTATKINDPVTITAPK